MHDLSSPIHWPPPPRDDVGGPRGQQGMALPHVVVVDPRRSKTTAVTEGGPTRWSLLLAEEDGARRFPCGETLDHAHPHRPQPQTTSQAAQPSDPAIMGAVLSFIHYYLSTTLSAVDAETGCEKEDANAALARSLKGQVMHIDSTKTFAHWPMGARHEAYARLQREADRILELAVPDPKRCQKFKKSDFALFSSLWWPDADWEGLYTAMLFTVCLFVWDDIIDTNEHALASDYEAANVWRTESLAYFQYQLRLSPPGQGEPACPDPVCVIFKEFGERFCKNFGPDQRQRMFSKIQNFVEHNRLEQAERLAGNVPDYDQYMYIRYGVTGVRMFSLLLEITNQFKLPSSVMDCKEMESVIKECNFIIIVVNDILSLKKEIATDCVVNAVPVLCKQGKSLQEAVDWLWDEMTASMARLDASADALDRMTAADKVLNANVRKFVDGIRIMDTGTLIYSIESPRYGISQYVNKDGTIDVVL